jgi:hypothetical protein
MVEAEVLLSVSAKKRRKGGEREKVEMKRLLHCTSN